MTESIRLTLPQMERLEQLGWEFLPYAPNEWQWMKFDNADDCVAIQCDETWEADLAQARKG